LKAFLIFYKYNAWIFDLTWTSLTNMTKRGITEEHFLPDRNEGVTIVNLSEVQREEASIAIRAGDFSSCEISINGNKKSLNSLLRLDNDMFFVASVQAEKNVSVYAIRCAFSSNPLHSSSTAQPFNLFMDDTLFEIYTPFSIEAQLGTQIPITIRVLALNPHILKINYDSSIFEGDNDELIIHSLGWKYFMLRPISTGLTTITVDFEDPTTENVISIPFLINVRNAFLYQLIPMVLLIATVFSLLYVASGRKLIDRLLAYMTT